MVIPNFAARCVMVSKGRSLVPIEKMLGANSHAGVGGNDQLVFDGSSVALNAAGEIIASATSFSEDLVLVDTVVGLAWNRSEPADCAKAVLAVTEVNPH